jgi:hypothetical protein
LWVINLWNVNFLAMSNAEELRKQAEHCQRLAAGVTTLGLAESLLAMARNYLERATKLDKELRR